MQVKTFKTPVINIYQNWHLNLGAIIWTFQFNNGFTIEISGAVVLCACLFLTHFAILSN